ncbi:MAG: prephenate dehydrogenase [Bacteroidota bacterium]
MTITIIGLGLIGGSLAISLKENGFADTIIGVDVQQESEDKALRRKIIDEALPLAAAMQRSELLILATPVDVMLKLLPSMLDQVEQQVVIDVGSTKELLIEKVATHPNRGRFVATHPMAGTEYSGIEAAIPNLYDHKYTVICDQEKSDADAVRLVQQMYQSIPMQILYLGAKEHDMHTAYISHISHMTSFALALTVLEKEKDEERIFELASTGFSSTVRLAKSSPDMWMPIFRQNRDNVLDVLNEHISTLTRFHALLLERKYDEIYQLMEQANHIRKILK